jgi:hypothetical protein
MVAQLLKASLPYVEGYSYAYLAAPTALTTRLDMIRNRGRLKLWPPRHPILNRWRLTYFLFKGYDVFDPVSVRRLPADYQSLFRDWDENTAGLWELGSVRYFLTPPEVARELVGMQRPRGKFVEIEKKPANVWDPQLGAVDDDICLVEFTAAMPLFELIPSYTTNNTAITNGHEATRKLTSPEFDPRRLVFLESPTGKLSGLTHGPLPVANSDAAVVEIERNEAHFAQLDVITPIQAVLLRSTKYNPDWHVTLDGKPSEHGLLRANGFFQGVIVPAGRHTITFDYRPPAMPLYAYVVGRLGLAMCVLIPLIRPKIAVRE